MRIPSTFKNRSPRQGFTLYELLAVIAIISVLASMSATVVSSASSTGSLHHSVELVVQNMSLARQISASSGASIAFVFTHAPANGTESPSILLLKASGEAHNSVTWTPVSRWQDVPSTIGLNVFPREGIESFFSSSGTGALSGNLPLEHEGKVISNYSYVIFNPDGTVEAPTTSPSLSLRRLNKNNADSEYIVLLQEKSARSKIIEL